jgi:patatin-like phospholipase/acyl hydrolase
MNASGLIEMHSRELLVNEYRILSLDGGGIRGYLTILLLERLEAEQPGFLGQFDLYAGTSTGSIIALALAQGTPLSEIKKLYEKKGKAIFHDSMLDNIRDLGFALGAKYDQRNLKKELIGHFGQTRLADLPKRVLVASFDLDHTAEDAATPRMWKAKFFHNFPGEDCDGDEFAVHVALRSSAAPLYFPSYQGYVDGFVVANNPSMCALCQVLDETDYRLQEIRLLSVGTGLNPRYVSDKRGDWGWVKWMFQVHPISRNWYALPLVYMMWEGSVGLVNYQCRQLLGDHFHRLDPLLEKPIDIDAVRSLKKLRQVAADADLDVTFDWMDDHIQVAVT